MVSYGSECPSHGVYARVTEVKHWIKFIAQGAEDTNCNKEIPQRSGIIIEESLAIKYHQPIVKVLKLPLPLSFTFFII